jgi:PiT family inorganic phosphate transporter
MSEISIILIAIALIFDFFNGVNDSANAIATVVSTKVLSPVKAVGFAAFFNFVAAFAGSTAVALTVGKVIDPAAGSYTLIAAGLIGAISWTFISTYFGLPISVSHALVGGLMGAALVGAGASAIDLSKLWLIIIFMFLSPLAGIVTGFLFMAGTLNVAGKNSPKKLNKDFKKLQLISAGAFSFSHGLNDAQKTMGIIVFILFLDGYFGASTEHIFIPLWVILSCHVAIALGTLIGGWRVVKTIGHKVTKLHPINGFAAETSGAGVIIGCSLAGIPISTTHVISSTIMGVGATKRASAVRWSIARNIMWAWILTIPISALIGAASYMALGFLF